MRINALFSVDEAFRASAASGVDRQCPTVRLHALPPLAADQANEPVAVPALPSPCQHRNCSAGPRERNISAFHQHFIRITLLELSRRPLMIRSVPPTAGAADRRESEETSNDQLQRV